jgi:putative RecB family exonuclease
VTFKNEHLSVSRLKKYEECQRSFFFQYVDPDKHSHPIEPRGDAASFGSALHVALEVAYKWIVYEEYSGRFPVDVLLDGYRAAWGEAKLVGVALFQEGLDLLRAYARRYPIVDSNDVLAVEREFNIDVGRFTLNGYIDVVERDGPDSIRIVDYKSNRQLFTREELDNDIQMSAYGLAARKLWPWAKRVSFAFEMLRHDVRQPTVRSATEIDDAAGYIISLGERSEADTGWEARLNSHCGYCDFRRRCDVYQTALVGEHEVTAIEGATALETLLANRDAAANVAKIAYARKSELDRVIKAKLDVDGEFDAGGFHVRMINASSKSYPDPSVVLRVFASAGLDTAEVAQRVFVVDKKRVEALCEETAGDVGTSRAIRLKTELEAAIVAVPDTPRLDVRLIKGTKQGKAKDVEDEAKEAARPRKRGTAKP